MSHLLDNPVWAALTTGNGHLSKGNDTAKFILPEIAPFAAVKELNTENFQILYDTIPFETQIAIFTNEKLMVADPWKVTNRIEGLQMVYLKDAVIDNNEKAIVKLNKEHIPEMLELTKLTNPGPFLSQTILFGNYEGIFLEGKLVAMAGQ
jgi:hypothetical protein